MTRRLPFFALGLASLLAFAAPVLAEVGYYRYPALHGDTLVFTAEGDLWTAPSAGGEARRLTTHAGEESQAAISPDGASVAFAAGYDGAVEAYVMPLAGGAPRRVSFDGDRVAVLGWSPRGEVAYLSESVSGPARSSVVRLVDPTTLAERTLPLAEANEVAFAADGAVFFTRGGLHRTGDHARGYRGGLMAELWRWREGEPEAVRLAPDVDAALSRPMVDGGRVVFVSDEDGLDNLWTMDADGANRRSLTSHRDLAVRGASVSGGRVVYQHGADLRLLDLASATTASSRSASSPTSSSGASGGSASRSTSSSRRASRPRATASRSSPAAGSPSSPRGRFAASSCRSPPRAAPAPPSSPRTATASTSSATPVAGTRSGAIPPTAARAAPP